jgi:hypothetical protein
VDGWNGEEDDQLLTQWREQGYLLIKGGYTCSEIDASVDELQGLMLADAPAVHTVYYEGMIRRAHGLRSTREEQAVTSAAPAASTATASAPPATAAAATAEKGTGKGKEQTQLETLALGAVTTELPDLPNKVRARYVRKFMGFVRPENPSLQATACKPELIEMVAKLCAQSEADLNPHPNHTPNPNSNSNPNRKCKVKLFQDMSMVKPPGGREKPWHQDSAYFNLPKSTPVVGVWIALGQSWFR